MVRVSSLIHCRSIPIDRASVSCAGSAFCTVIDADGIDRVRVPFRACWRRWNTRFVVNVVTVASNNTLQVACCPIRMHHARRCEINRLISSVDLYQFPGTDFSMNLVKKYVALLAGRAAPEVNNSRKYLLQF